MVDAFWSVLIHFCFLLKKLWIYFDIISRDTHRTCSNNLKLVRTTVAGKCAGRIVQITACSVQYYLDKLAEVQMEFTHFTISVGETRRVYFLKEKKEHDSPNSIRCDLAVCVHIFRFTDYHCSSRICMVISFGLKMFSLNSRGTHCTDSFNKPVL